MPVCVTQRLRDQPSQEQLFSLNCVTLLRWFSHVSMSVHFGLNVAGMQGSPQVDIKAEWMGVVWAEFVTTSIDFLPTPKLNKQ